MWLCLFVALLLGVPVLAAADITTGLVGHWRLDNASGTSVTDSSGSALPAGTLLPGGSPPTWVTGKLGTSALAMTRAAANYVSVPDAAALNITGTLTLAVWVNPTTVSPGGTQNLLVKTNGACAGGCATNYGLNMANGGTVDFFFTNPVDSYHVYKMSTPIPAGVWTHLAVVYNLATTTITHYVNGVAAAASATSGTPTLTALTTNTGDLCLGGFSTAFGGDLGGSVDDYRIYTAAKTAADIQELYTQGVGKRRTGAY